jgi:hypothetical protein
VTYQSSGPVTGDPAFAVYFYWDPIRNACSVVAKRKKIQSSGILALTCDDRAGTTVSPQDASYVFASHDFSVPGHSVIQEGDRFSFDLTNSAFSDTFDLKATGSFTGDPSDSSPVLPGDLNQDGKIGVQDATLALAAVIGLISPSDEQRSVGDVKRRRQDQRSGRHADSASGGWPSIKRWNFALSQGSNLGRPLKFRSAREWIVVAAERIFFAFLAEGVQPGPRPLSGDEARNRSSGSARSMETASREAHTLSPEGVGSGWPLRL